MTEAEWLVSNDPTQMLEFVQGFDRPVVKTWGEAVGLPPSDRKLRLFAVACYAESFGWGRLSEGGYLKWAEGDPDDDDTAGSPRRLAASHCETNSVEHGEITRIQKTHLIREIVGNPFRPVPRLICGRCKGERASGGGALTYWSFLKCSKCEGRGNTTEGRFIDRQNYAMAQAIYDERRFEDCPVLADALEDVGCENQSILDHLRGPGPHVRGCHILDLLLGRE